MRHYSVEEVAKKLGLDFQTVINMCKNDLFKGAYYKNGNWIIPENNFVTTREQDKKAEETLQHIDKKNIIVDNHVYVTDHVVAKYYGVSTEVVKNWINQGVLSGKQSEGNPDQYLIPKDEFEYLKDRRDQDDTEEVIQDLLGVDGEVDTEE